MRFKKTDHRVYDFIMEADRERGVTMWEIMEELVILGPKVRNSLDRLEDENLIEARWESGEWGNDSGASGKRYYRLTCESPQTLAARLHEQTSNCHHE